MNTKSEKLLRLIGGNVVSLTEILDNLNIVKVESDDIKISYTLIRKNKDMPWPAPYQIGKEVNKEAFYCCSYVTLESEEDIKQLNVYLVNPDSDYED